MRLLPGAAALLLVALTLFACQSSEDRTAADVAAIRALTKAWENGIATDDVNALVDLRTDDYVQMAPDRPTLRGKKRLEEFYNSAYAQFSFKGSVWPVEGTEEIVVSEDWAIHASEYILKFTPRAGGGTTEEYGKIVVICKKQVDGSWKLAREIWNRNAPAGG